MEQRQRRLIAGQPVRLVGFVVLAAILAVTLAFWVITSIEGDPTNHLEERQPSPSTASPS